MSRDKRGKVKQKLWLRPVCTDDSEKYRLGQKARQDFWRDARGEEDGAGYVISPDWFSELEELAESFME